MEKAPEPEPDPNGEGIIGWVNNESPYLDGLMVSVFVWPDEEPGAGVREPRRPRPDDGRPVAAVLDQQE